MKLDRSRPFGEVVGDERIGFTQDGRSFDHGGNEIDPVLIASEQASALSRPILHLPKKK